MGMRRPQAVIFDLDGTLFKTETLSLPAYHRTFDQLRREGLFSGATPPEERFLHSLGMLLPEIWSNVLPDAPNDVRVRANELLLDYQMQFLRAGYGELYPGVLATLENLHRRGYKLCVASNGVEEYVKGVIHATGLSPLFTVLYSAGEFQTASKVELVRLLLQRYPFASAWMCGDRLSDVEAGLQNGLPVVGCTYGGFHAKDELQQANMMISSFAELLDYLPQE